MVSTLLNVSLIEHAERHHPKLMNHRHNREDALQTLRIVQLVSTPEDLETVACKALVWLEYELGVVPKKPTFLNPISTPPEALLENGTFIDDLDQALKAIRIAA